MSLKLYGVCPTARKQIRRRPTFGSRIKEVERNYGYKEINLYVKKKTINDVINDSINTITNPKTYDNIFTYVYILIGSALTITLIIFKFINQKEQD